MTPNEENSLAARKLILSIETAVEGGLSLLERRTEIDGWRGTRAISSAEDVLEQISKLLERNKVEREEIGTIVVSNGAGSSTGEKIGLAIAKGLAKSLLCRLIKVSVLESLLIEIGDQPESEWLSVIPAGKHRVQWQKFLVRNKTVRENLSDIKITFQEDFISEIKKAGCGNLVLASGFDEIYVEALNNKYASKIIISSSNLAKLNGQAIYNASDNELAEM